MLPGARRSDRGGRFTTLFMESLGAIQFDGTGTNTDQAIVNAPLPSPIRSTLVSPFWDQLHTSVTWESDPVWEMTGTARDRELVVETAATGRARSVVAQ